MRIIDARGKSCPEPVIMLKKALKEENTQNIKEIVDNELSKQNIEKMLSELRLPYTSGQENGDYVVTVNRTDGDGEQIFETKKLDEIIVLSSDEMGKGSSELGKMLMKNFIYALTESDSLPSHILLYNSGVKLASEDEETIKDLKKLAQKGVQIVVCGLCLNYFGLESKLAVGSVSNMYAILQTKLSAKKIIQP